MPTVASVSSSRPVSWGSRPARRSTSARVSPSSSVSPSARSGESAPVSSREPMHGTPNLAPSSSVKQATPTGTEGVTARSFSRSSAAKADTTPSGPS